ncbi:hypothetical protein B5G09_13345 [Alistipes sp. An54]|nr:hypothetical protein B5G09_13345 [Alistipes sp. An54]
MKIIITVFLLVNGSRLKQYGMTEVQMMSMLRANMFLSLLQMGESMSISLEKKVHILQNILIIARRVS